MGNTTVPLSSITNNSLSLAASKPTRKLAPIEAPPFHLPSPLPSFPPGAEFAKGAIDLGGLQVRQVSTFTKVWAAHGGGSDDLGATFFQPSSLPDGFSPLGHYAQPNNRPLFGWLLVGRPTGLSDDALAKPSDYTLLWTSESSADLNQDGRGYFWLPTPPEGYRAVGLVVTGSPGKPSLDEVRCVRSDLTEEVENDEYVWSTDGFSVNASRPAVRGISAAGVPVGSFLARANNGITTNIACLKNKASDFTNAMPNLNQVEALMRAYAPRIYLHSDEEYLPSSVNWFFSNGALLYDRGNQSNSATPINPDGSNLPQGGSNDGAYWIDLPADDGQKDRIVKGDISSTKVYLHVKPMLGATFTDVAIWIFYPFNGPARAKVEFLNVKLGRIGEHVGDWEHMTLRISNLTGELRRVYFSEHSAGRWVEASQAEFDGETNMPVGYASLHGHAMYAKPGLVLQGDAKLGIGIRNDTDKGSSVSTAGRWEVAAAEYLGVEEPPWVNYMREWGPKISYDIATELKNVERLLPGRLKKRFESIIGSLPDEVLGEEGPTGPKEKHNWAMDEA
ncbi:uncharacterized protein LOC121998234 [Zingiber officinale]|uniref:Vacuolar protein sorting-associated protein 62 n=1 Tax=Zingiber officinale TaxID=94328 RepID=A0A8J5L1R0_ZINOF|nr:uncharacterized protein LOC121998234 [Zingiber officinale]KAG6501777.1 hypothetical protein ZIOFF_041661 [Zingiber officinale]